MLTHSTNQRQPEMQEEPLCHVPPGQNQPQLQDVHLSPASPMFSRRAFKPVAPPSVESEPISRTEDQLEGAEPIPEDVSR